MQTSFANTDFQGHTARIDSLLGYQVLEVKQMKEAIDPVCEMTVEVETARFKTEHDGIIYYFCAIGCQRTFEAAPEHFLP